MWLHSVENIFINRYECYQQNMWLKIVWFLNLSIKGIKIKKKYKNNSAIGCKNLLVYN